MNKIFATFLAAILLFAFVPSTQAQQSFTEIAQMRLAMGPGGVSQRGFVYDRAYDTPDRGHHQATQNNVNVWGAINTGLQLYNAWEVRKLNRKLDRIGDEPRPRRERRNERREREDYYEPRRAERQPEPEPAAMQPTAAPPEFRVLNATSCPVLLYLNGQRLTEVQAGQETRVPTLVGLTAAGNFRGGKTAYGILTPVGTDGAVVTAPQS